MLFSYETLFQPFASIYRKRKAILETHALEDMWIRDENTTLLWLYPWCQSIIRARNLRQRNHVLFESGFSLVKMLYTKASQTQGKGNMTRGAYVLPGGLLHHPKCLAVVRTCKGNSVYSLKCPPRSKGHLGIQSTLFLKHKQ